VTEAQLIQIMRAGHPLVYTAFVAAGGAAGGALIRRDTRDWVVTPAQRIAVIATVFVGGLVGAALPAFVSGGLMQHQAEQYLIGPKTILGGLLAGFLAVAVLKRMLGITAETSDAFARGTCLMMAIGRLGCYAAHCCVGVASTAVWARDFGDGTPRLPIQLVEAAILFTLFGVLQRLHARRALPDRRLFVYFAVYGTARFVLEFWREPVAQVSAGIGFYQWLALLLATIGTYQLLKRTRVRTTMPSAAVPGAA
jgi:phosphatidylglycerol:prolipoprotein diacylglycerol transferase